jgi:hypothetical protein
MNARKVRLDARDYRPGPRPYREFLESSRSKSDQMYNAARHQRVFIVNSITSHLN